MDPSETNQHAQKRLPVWVDSFSHNSPSNAPRRTRSQDDLLNDPTTELEVDFNSQEGFYEAAKKKKGTTQKAPVIKPVGGGDGGGGDDKKEELPPGDGNGGDAGAGGDGDKDKNGSGASDPIDAWGDFAAASSKKIPGKNGTTPDVPTTFEDIKLAEEPEKKSTGWFGGWGAKWASAGKSPMLVQFQLFKANTPM